MTSDLRQTESVEAAPPPQARLRPGGGSAAGTAAVLVATAAADAGAAALLPWDGGTVLSRLLDQLAGLGVARTDVLTRPVWAADVRRAAGGERGVRVHAVEGTAGGLRALAQLAARDGGALVVAAADVVADREAVAELLADPRGGTGALVGEAGTPAGVPVRVERGRVVSASSERHRTHRPSAAFLGLLAVAAADRAALAEAARRLAGLTEEAPAGEDDVTALLLVGLVRGGVRVRASDLHRLRWARARTPAAVAAASDALAAGDEDRRRLDSAVKASDGLVATFLVSPYSRHLARWAARHGLTPNAVTAASMLLGLAAGALFATGHRWGLIAGAVALLAAFVGDCVDGQLARYSRRYSRLGAWLDSIFDRAKEYVALAGLAIGAARAGDPVWTLACSALILQVVRHSADLAFAASEDARAAATPQPPLEQRDDALGAAAGGGQDAARGTARPARARAATRWPRSLLAFGIGERFAVLALTAALFTPRVAFVVLLAWGGAAAAYTLAGQTLRSGLR